MQISRQTRNVTTPLVFDAVCKASLTTATGYSENRMTTYHLCNHIMKQTLMTILNELKTFNKLNVGTKDIFKEDYLFLSFYINKNK